MWMVTSTKATTPTLRLGPSSSENERNDSRRGASREGRPLRDFEGGPDGRTPGSCRALVGAAVPGWCSDVLLEFGRWRRGRQRVRPDVAGGQRDHGGLGGQWQRGS